MTEILKLKEHGVRSVESAESTVVLDEVAEEYFSTNPAGSLLWKRLQEGTTRADLIAALIDAYQIETDRAEKDVDAYIAQLQQFNLLESESA